MGETKILGLEIFLKNIVGKKISSEKKNLKKFWVQKYFGSGKILGQKKFGVKKKLSLIFFWGPIEFLV